MKATVRGAKGEGRRSTRAYWRAGSGNALRLSLLALSLLIAPGSLHAQDRAWWDTLPAPAPVATSWSYTSQYVPMHDGVRLAVDVYLPDGVARPMATIVEQTRYRRQLLFRDPARNARPAPPSGLVAFVRAGYAVVVVDVRGTGASFGHRTTEFSPTEVRDGWDVLDWIVAQPWSDGAVGATGVSYPGTTAELMGTLGHPALKAVAPRFSVYDLYADAVFPGGIFLEPFIRAWGSMVARMDANRFDAANGPVSGVRPVDGPHGDSLLALAVAGHARNANIFEQVKDLRARDDTAADGFTFADISPHARYDTLSRRIPIYSYGGWADGFSAASINRFLEQPSPGSRLIMGPWNHGGAWSYYPGSPPVRSQFNHLRELLRFFDHHVRGIDTGIDREPAIHYFTTGSNEWKAVGEWPVATRDTVFQAELGGFLLPRTNGHADIGEFIPSITVDSSLGTGQQSRWNTILGGGAVYYSPRPHSSHGEHRGWIAYETQPLTRALLMTGRPVAVLSFATTGKPEQVFVYVEEVDSTGAGWLVAEGQARLDTEAPGEAGRVDARIELLPVSHRFAAGGRIRLVIAANDRDHFALPSTPGTLHFGPLSAWLTLPLEP